ncbi:MULTISPECIES: hypothetical protein [Legionella]|uniref:Uncharacterized protein n=1 Tax=Legionella drozanskii LLAP-1 TaxID=1212489 RepID=A0A0W0TE27_9GAMM|nr:MULTISPECIES: hypothetical protein [Legionella]KTC93857.1 hypothetical protein Ldro_0207 [Legionella drozanskii LLAP-1]PJE10770.1 MAG: hypothetical protein CK430_09755 [Legionella sp.]
MFRFPPIIAAFCIALSPLAYGQVSILPDVKVIIKTDVSDGASEIFWRHGLGMFIWNFGMCFPNLTQSGGLDLQTELETFIHGENDGPPGQLIAEDHNQNLKDSSISEGELSTTNIDIFHDSQNGETSFCILQVTLDRNTSKLLSANWLVNDPYQPDPSVKPARCTFSMADQVITINVTNN